jgi:hypothetical protein
VWQGVARHLGPGLAEGSPPTRAAIKNKKEKIDGPDVERFADGELIVTLDQSGQSGALMAAPINRCAWKQSGLDRYDTFTRRGRNRTATGKEKEKLKPSMQGESEATHELLCNTQYACVARLHLY